MYNSPYFNTYNPQASVDRINSQIAELEKLKSQIPQVSIPTQQPTNLTQNFQLASTNNNIMRYADNIDEVKKNIVISETPFFSKDMSVMWLKNTNGDIKSYTLAEIIEKDEKDIMIESLQLKLNEMEEKIRNAESDNNNVDEPVKDKKTSNVSNVKSRNTK